MCRFKFAFLTVTGLLCLTSRGFTATPGTCTAYVSTPANLATFQLSGDNNMSVHVAATASVSVTGNANEQFSCNWNMFLKCNPDPGTLGKDTSNGFLNETCNALGNWSRSASFDGYPVLTADQYTADCFATVQVGQASTSAQYRAVFTVTP